MSIKKLFGSSENKHNSIINEEEYFSRRIDKLFPHLERYSTNRRKISLHSFRAFGITKAVRTIGDELMVVDGNPSGYVFFTKTFPIAFKTDHNPLWNDLVKKSCVGKGCE